MEQSFYVAIETKNHIFAVIYAIKRNGRQSLTNFLGIGQLYYLGTFFDGGHETKQFGLIDYGLYAIFKFHHPTFQLFFGIYS